jgi:hypothetical protein
VPGGARGGHAGVEHELLGPRLRRLDARGGRVGPEHREPARPHPVDEARRERRLGPDERVVRPLGLGERDERVDVVGAHGHAAAEAGDARVAGRGDDLEAGLLARELPSERVLAAAAADDADLHGGQGNRPGAARSPTCRPAGRGPS